eukprot:4059798-Prymnesium_polylepis.1
MAGAPARDRVVRDARLHVRNHRRRALPGDPLTRQGDPLTLHGDALTLHGDALTPRRATHAGRLDDALRGRELGLHTE